MLYSDIIITDSIDVLRRHIWNSLLINKARLTQYGLGGFVPNQQIGNAVWWYHCWLLLKKFFKYFIVSLTIRLLWLIKFLILILCCVDTAYVWLAHFRQKSSYICLRMNFKNLLTLTMLQKLWDLFRLLIYISNLDWVTVLISEVIYFINRLLFFLINWRGIRKDWAVRMII